MIGYIRVFANSSTLSALPVPLSLFLAEHPNSNVDLEEHMSETTVRAIYDGIALEHDLVSVGRKSR